MDGFVQRMRNAVALINDHGRGNDFVHKSMLSLRRSSRELEESLNDSISRSPLLAWRSPRKFQGVLQSDAGVLTQGGIFVTNGVP